MYKEDLALNNLQGLICHKAQHNQHRLYGTLYVLPLEVTVDLGVMAMKRYSKFPLYSEPEPHQLSVIPKIIPVLDLSGFRVFYQ